MAIINSVALGRARGTIDNIVYSVVNGRTVARRIPSRRSPATLAQRRSAALFTLIQFYTAAHRRTIKATFSKSPYGSAANQFVSLNYNAFREALAALTDSFMAGTPVTLAALNAALATYTTAHPDTIFIAHLNGYRPVYLNGAWPDTLTLQPTDQVRTTIIIQVNDAASDAVITYQHINTATPDTVTLTLLSANANMGTVSGGGSYTSGATATLTATPVSGYHFTQWSDGNTNATRTLTLTTSLTLTAQFAANSSGSDSGSGSGSDSGDGSLGA